MPSNSNRKRLATAYASAAGLPYQSALARVVEMQALGIELSCRDAAALQQSVLLLQHLPQDASSIELPVLASDHSGVPTLVVTGHPGWGQRVPSVPVPPYLPAVQRIVLGNNEDGREVRLGDQEADLYSRYPTVLVAGRPGSGKSNLLLQIAHQQRQLDERVTYLFFWEDSSVAKVLSNVGMDRVLLSPELLQQCPGALDPMLSSDRFTMAGDLLSEVIVNLLRLGGGEPERSRRRWLLHHEIREGVRDRRNATSGDVIFGNQATDPAERTTGISDTEIRDRLQSENTTFSRAVLGYSQAGRKLGSLIRSGNVLVQWSREWGFADPSKASQDMTNKEVEAETCALATYLVVADSAGQRGGTFIVENFDSVLNRCPYAHHMLILVARAYRTTNVMPVIGVQSLAAIDIGDASLLETCDRMVLMRLNSNVPGEVEAFSRLTGLPTAEYYRWADLNPRLAPGLGYYVDRAHNWQGLIETHLLLA